jgi:hypothetical protein
METEYIKCNGCKCKRHISEYEIYKGVMRKSCIMCKTNRQKLKQRSECILTKTENKVETEPNMNYYLLLHNRKWSKFNREFEERSAFPRHKYEMRHVFVDIRDCLTYNY